MAARGATGGERKLVTHLFSDLKGSTALIEGLDPEEARAIVDPALQLMMDAVHCYEGYVAQVPGDGIFALFGAPIAHEDHPQRALYAALLMQEEMRRYSDRLREQGHPPLLMRIGINTGEVVVRSIHKEDLHTDYVPVGRSTNIAARMEQLAAPGSILVSEQTHKLTAGYFEFKPLGKTQVKGIEEPLNVYEVLGAGPLRTRLQVAARRGLTRFVGRHTEMEQIKRALEQAKAGHGQIVGVMGEPGVGKSRLFYEFKLTSQSGCLVLEALSVSYGKASPYLPVIELLKTYFQIQPQDDERQRQAKVMGQVLTLDRSLEDTLPYLFSLLGIEDPTSSLQQMDAQIRRRRTFDALKRLFLRESLNQPLILIFEDLHWIDTETQGFLDTLSESVASARILLLVNYRPEYRPEWGQKTYYTQLRLAPLGKDEAEEFLTELLGTTAVGATHASPLQALKQLILEKTEGNPFFIEEVVQTLAEEGLLMSERGNYRLEKAPAALHISPTVQGVLTARIDRLAPAERAFLHQLAIIGRQFPLSLVQKVVSQSEEDLYRLLSSLQSKEFLYEQPTFPEPEYLFKHALTQEVAYGTVLQDRRKALHERTAQAIEEVYQAKLEDHYSDLAHHYSRSGNIQKAVDYLHLAGQQAIQRSANVEAISHLTNALELLKTLPDTPEHIQHELGLHLTLGPVLMNIRGMAAPEVDALYTRARELCQQVGETSQLFPVLFGFWRFSLLRAELPLARELGGQLLRLAQQAQDSALLLAAHRVLGTTLLWQGEIALAREHLEQGIALYDPQQHRPLAFVYGMDSGMTCQIFTAWVLWLLGYPDQALQRGQEGITTAHESSHPYSLSFALAYTAGLHQFRREGRLAQERAEAAMALSAEQGFAQNLSQAAILRGWALAEQGQGEEGIAQIRQGLAAYRATGAELLRPYYLALLAEAYVTGGQVEEGLKILAEALARVDKTGEHSYEAELYRIKGELSLQSAVHSQQSEIPNTQHPTPSTQAEAEAEACFLKAIDIARKQQAKSLELRATVSLARLWQQQGKQPTARNMLSTIYNWFTEGFDTKDLREAKTLLAALDRQ
jgi:class 3 adenylate cyclase/predicted ATPase